MIQKIIFNTISGAVTGYITNNVAIKMLFKQYLGFGGVIEKEYKSFIENISNLIERDLINHNTLKPEIESDEFKSVVKEVVKTFLSLELIKVSNKSFSSLKGYEDSISNIISYIEKEKYILIKDTLSIYLNKPLNFYISQEQFDFILSKVEVIFNENKRELEAIIYNSISNKVLKEVISNKVFLGLSSNIQGVINRVDFREFDGDFNKTYSEFLEIINIDEVIKEIEFSLKNSRLRDFINDGENLSYELIDRIITILKSQKGKYLLDVAISHILELLKRVDLTLKDILGDEVLNKFTGFLNKEIPIIIDLLIKEIQNDKTKIEEYINEAIDEYLDSSLFGKFLNFIKKYVYTDNIAKKENVVGKAIRVIAENKEEAPRILTQELINFLVTNTIGDIVKKLEEEGVISKEQISKLIHMNLTNLKTRKVDFIDEFLEKKVADIYDVNLNFIKEKTLPQIFKALKENYIYKDNFKNHLNKELEKVVLSLKEKKFSEFIENLDLRVDIKEAIKPFYSKLDKKLKDLGEFEVDFDIKEIVRRYEDKKISSVVLTMQNEETQNNLSEFIISTLNNNLHHLFEGKVAPAVNKELSKFTPSEIRDMVENFMGKELAPINTLGAILGGVAGAGYYMATAPFNNPLLKYSTPAIYGLTGMFTNYLAIKMLFKPYEKKWYLPFFSPGVVAKKKASFAKNIAEFVKSDILTDKAILGMYENNEEKLKEFLKDFIKKDNFKFVDVELKLNSQKIANLLFDKIIEDIQNNKEKVASFLIEILDSKKDILLNNSSKIANITLQELLKADFSKELKEFIINSLDDKNLKEYIPYILDQIDANIDTIFEKIISSFEFENVKIYMLNFEENFNSFTQNHTLKDFINVKELSKFISKELINLISSDDVLDSILNRIKNTHINPQARFKDLFDGKFETFVYQNLDYLIDLAIEKVDSYRDYVKKEATKDLGFIAKLVAQGKIEGAIDAIFKEAIPRYLEEKKSFLYSLADRFLRYKLIDVGINERVFKDGLLKDEIKEILNDYSFQKNIEKLSFICVDTILSIDIKTFLEILNIRNLRQLIEILSSLLENGFKELESNLKQNKEQIPNLIKSFVKVILEDISKREKLLVLLSNINLDEEIKYSLDKIKRDEKFISDLEIFLEDNVYRFFISEFYSKDILKKDFERIILNLDKKALSEIYVPFLQEFFINLNDLLSNELKEEILGMLVEASFNSIKIHLIDIVKSIDIKEIIIREINAMHPKEIEEMFYSFAGNYFNKLIIYGIGGAVFGVPSVFV